MIRRALILAGLLLAILPPSAPQARESRAALLDYLGGQGCVIGPATRHEVAAAGLAPDVLDALANKARANGQADQQGDWLVLSRDLCTIRLPQISPVLKLADPDVRRNFSDKKVGRGGGRPGCYLKTDALLADLQASRGWDADRANSEYIRLVAAALISGDMTIYMDTPVAAPPGFQLLTGECGRVPEIDAMRRDHAVLTGQFDPLIRTLATVTICKKGGHPDIFRSEIASLVISGIRDPNAWRWMELLVIAMGAGWYEGMGATDIGTPRPPFCHYE